VLDQSAAVQDSRFPTAIYLDGYKYSRCSTSARRTRYRCSRYRSAGCKGKVSLIMHARKFTDFIDHTCAREDHVAPETPEPCEAPGQDRDAFQPAATTPFQPLIAPLFRLGPNQIDPVLIRDIESPPLSLVCGSALNFLQFNCMSGYDADKTPNRVIGWAHPHLMKLLKHEGSTVCVDTSLRRLPPGFEQSIVLAAHDKPSGLFVPVFYVLCTTRTQSAYHNAISLIVQATRRKLKPEEVVCAFDNQLINVLQAQFPNAVVKGSVFLFKQACRAQMDGLGIQEEAANIAMEKGVLDMLVSVRPDRIATAGIAWVKKQIKTKCADAGVPYEQDPWCSFWINFRRTWITQFSPAVWNVHGMSNSVITRTTNPLKNFHRELNPACATRDPDLPFFVATIEKMTRCHVADLAAETTTLPEAVDVNSEVEEESPSSDDGCSGTESEVGDNGVFVKMEPSGSHEQCEDDDLREAQSEDVD
jgi:hypothetical protein